jgi:hypothetical protein
MFFVLSLYVGFHIKQATNVSLNVGRINRLLRSSVRISFEQIRMIRTSVCGIVVRCSNDYIDNRGREKLLKHLEL